MDEGPSRGGAAFMSCAGGSDKKAPITAGSAIQA
jgi:hypothetical protein